MHPVHAAQRSLELTIRPLPSKYLTLSFCYPTPFTPIHRTVRLPCIPTSLPTLIQRIAHPSPSDFVST